MADKEMWEWVMARLNAQRIANVAIMDQMLAARRDFKSILPLCEDDPLHG